MTHKILIHPACRSAGWRGDVVCGSVRRWDLKRKIGPVLRMGEGPLLRRLRGGGLVMDGGVGVCMCVCKIHFSFRNLCFSSVALTDCSVTLEGNPCVAALSAAGLKADEDCCYSAAQLRDYNEVWMCVLCCVMCVVLCCCAMP